MLNRINRFVRNIESKYSCSLSTLDIETAVYVPERVATKTSIPWKTIYDNIHKFFPDDHGIRGISEFLAEDKGNGIQTLSLVFIDENDHRQSKTVDLSVTKLSTLNFDKTIASLSDENSSTAQIKTQLSYYYGGGNIKAIPGDITISNLIRKISPEIKLESKNRNISAILNLSVNNSNIPLSSSSTYQLSNSISAINKLNLTPGTNGIQSVQLSYYDMDGNLSSTDPINLSVLELRGFSFDNNINSLTAKNSASAVVSAILSYAYGGTESSYAPSVTIKNLIRQISLSNLSLTYLPDSRELSAKLEYKINNSNASNSPLTSQTEGLSGVLGGLSFGEFKLYNDIDSQQLSANIAYNLNGEPKNLTASPISLSNYADNKLILSTFTLDHNNKNLSAEIEYYVDGIQSTLTTNTISLSAYKTEEEDPIFWQAERDVKMTLVSSLASGQVNEIYLSAGREQTYNWTGSNTGTLSLYIPESESTKSGRLTLYLEERPSINKVLVLSNENINTLPTRRSWLTTDGIWKFEFDSIPGSTKWHYIQSTRYDFDN